MTSDEYAMARLGRVLSLTEGRTFELLSGCGDARPDEGGHIQPGRIRAIGGNFAPDRRTRWATGWSHLPTGACSPLLRTARPSLCAAG